MFQSSFLSPPFPLRSPDRLLLPVEGVPYYVHTPERFSRSRLRCEQVDTCHRRRVAVPWQQNGRTMGEDDTEETLFGRKLNQRNRDGCQICRNKCRKCINTCLTWEMVLLVVDILVFLIIIFKWLKDGKLDQRKKTLFRTYESGGHFMQGILFVLLIVPFKFNKRIIKWIFNLSMKNEMYMEECRQEAYQQLYGDIEQSRMGNYLYNEENENGGVIEEGSGRNYGMNSALGSIDNNNMDQREVNHETVVERVAGAGEMDTGNGGRHAQFIRIGYGNSGRGGNGMDHQEGSARKNTSGERLTMNRRRNGSNCRNDSLHREHANRDFPLCESFFRSLVFPINTPKHIRERIRYFFLCAKLYGNMKISFLFVLKYASAYILMFAYPLYNLVKRKLLHPRFHLTSYYMNEFDFASGLLAGSLFVLVYGLVKFFASLCMNRRSEKFYFFDNYPFLSEVKCLCDENVRIIIHNNPHLKSTAIQYLNAYRIYKIFLLKGIFILFLLCIFSFAFTLTSMNAPPAQVHAT